MLQAKIYFQLISFCLLTTMKHRLSSSGCRNIILDSKLLSSSKCRIGGLRAKKFTAISKVGEEFPGSIMEVGDLEYSVPRARISLAGVPKNGKYPISAENVTNAFLNALDSTRSGSIAGERVEEYKGLGEGRVLAAFWPVGMVIVLWDGRHHVDINLFTYEEGMEFPDEFTEHFRAAVDRLDVALRDVQPRGFGRVVNFRKDVEPRVVPHWALRTSRRRIYVVNDSGDVN